MTPEAFDVVVVGARVAGSPTAMLLAGLGHRVLLVERHSLRRDVVTGHYIHPPGVGYLAKWGLLDEAAAGCPPITRVSADLGTVRYRVDYRDGWVEIGHRRLPLPGGQRHAWPAYAPRRTVLDMALCRAAVAAGAVYHERTEAESLILEDDRVVGIRLTARSDGGMAGEVRARVVVGADGVRSMVARQAGAPEYDVTPSGTCSYRSYWAGVEADGLEYHVRGGQSVLMMPTNDGLTWVSVGSPMERFAELRRDVETGYLSAIQAIPELRERLAGGTRAERIVGMAVPDSYYRRPYGPGWALVGDAGYHKDPSAGQGITDAFRDAELLAAALDDVLSGRAGHEAALSRYESERNAASRHGHALTAALSTRDARPVTPAAMLAGFGPLRPEDS